MNKFLSDDVEIAYTSDGDDDGEPILLIHGFASNVHTNWASTGWIKFLASSGYRVIAIDNRGHGQSEKLYDTEKYGGPIMAKDASNLLRHLNIKRAHIVGYSMGARITAFLLLQHSHCIATATLSGMGHNLVRGMGAPGPIAHALEAPTIDDVKHDTARTFRAFAESTNSDLLALAACIRSAREKILPEQLGQIDKAVLVAVGTNDVVAGPAQPLADLIPGATVLDIPNRDHMKAVGDKVFKAGVLAFIQSHPIDEARKTQT